MQVVGNAVTVSSATHSSSVEAYKLDNGHVVNLTDWNGEFWGAWWYDDEPSVCGNCAKPVYREILDENGESLDQYETAEIIL